VVLVGPSGPDQLTSALAATNRVCDVLDARAPEGSTGARIDALARAATGTFLLLLDARLTPEGGGWLDALIELAQQDAIGAAGAVLLAPDGTIDHAGLVLGAGAIAACALRGAPAWTRGHRANALDVRNCTAVSARCLLTRRTALAAAGGFDTALDPPLLDVDYGLRLAAAGLRVAITPHARLRGPAACGALDAPAPDGLARLRDRWGARLDSDPYYNPNFDRRVAAFTLPARGS